MTDILNFEKLKIRKMLKEKYEKYGKIKKEHKTGIEIFLTVIKFSHDYMQEKYDDPLEMIAPKSKTIDLFNDNEDYFQKALIKITDYWEIDFNNTNNLFCQFETIQDICVFVEKNHKAT
ncbi:hypothetical protein ACM26V_16925 [Salipaludibacillus sp. HK11]|uniref:hypothetical protein n=1 Tax=Salipaludibacillus sp. HK11 TaxID=3394320 RepID=UPI0039FCF495